MPSMMAAVTLQSVDQLVLGVARVDVVADHRDVGGVGAEGLVFDFAEI